LAIAVVNAVKTNIANMKLKHEDELDKSINVKLNNSFIFASDIFVFTSLTTAIAKTF
jgi:hypothetical protein